uniref:Transposase n=1 Tax=Kalanchoe fedtschenkoi TaxID=63787 RepID=A0A7N0TVC0_KALFE
MVMVHELPFKFAEYEVLNMLVMESSPEFKKIEYMVITCHFVCEWKLHKRVLSFYHIPPPHNGVAVCEALNHYSNDWNLTNKLATVTDVLSYQRKLLVDGVFFHVCCCAHIINLLVQDGLNDIEDIIHSNKPSDAYWIKVEKICSFLHVFHDITKIISGTEYLTSNLFLPELAQIKEELEEKAKSDGDNNLLIFINAVLDPRNKLKVIQFYSSSLYDSKLRDHEYVSVVTYTLHEVYADGIDAQGDGNGAFNNTNVTGKGLSKERKKFDGFINGLSVECLTSDLDTYLEDGGNRLKFRILSKLASDILAILITSVASEFTFNADKSELELKKILIEPSSSIAMLGLARLVCTSI